LGDGKGRRGGEEENSFGKHDEDDRVRSSL
jgi:hypothetical protein